MFGIRSLCGLRLDDATIPGIEGSLEHRVEGAHGLVVKAEDQRTSEGRKTKRAAEEPMAVVESVIGLRGE